MNEIKGGCNCGAVRYQINRNPMTVAICHCSNCRRQSGSAFSVNVIIPAAAMHISGTLTTYTDHDTDSGQPVDRQFCAQCGSPICSLSSASPQIAIIKAGTADDPARLTPAIHVWTSTALPWVNIPADLPQFARNPQ
ncbi:GFA family protein [Sphingopyxis yananensis]|uniref:GFA family protein n=1 Tax=Sphingopyxis yananensis TaxID=2886687 RepID=UPI001D10FDC0|nr:GFA family protein [Sphingopyxis yananensis]MCC2601963.1 GFA family protein [Sphingopyxis yananensis]